MAKAPLDVVGVGNAIVDVIAKAKDSLLGELGLAKGAMTLIDADQAEALYAKMGSGMETSGGSAANTIAGIASLGGKAAYIGKVRDDELGQVFDHDIRAIGVDYRSRPVTSGPPTARCLIFVTPGAQRHLVGLVSQVTIETVHADVELAVFDETGGQLAPDHAGGAGDQNMHSRTP